LSVEAKYEKLLKDYKKQSIRLDRIVKHSDRQQNAVLELSEKIAKLHDYDTQQQNSAKEKQDLLIVNELLSSGDLKSNVIYKASDILSGDFYSVFKLKDGSTFVYIIDGQGHGITPSLTIFAVASAILNIVDKCSCFEDIVNNLFPIIQKFLGEIEQLTYTLLSINSSLDKIKYVSGGMYPFILKTKHKVLTYKTNNLPFMNFSPIPVIMEFDVEDFDSLLIYSDGLVEDLKIKDFAPLDILNSDEKFIKIKDYLKDKSFDDDITVVKLSIG